MAIAEEFGWDGIAVDTAEELEEAVTTALPRDGPVLIDVSVPTEEPSASAAADYELSIDTL